VVVLVIVLGVLVLGLFVALAMARSSLTATRSRVEALTTQLDATTSEAERAAADANEARERAEVANARADEAEATRDAQGIELQEAAAAAAEADKRAEAAEALANQGLDAMGTWALETLRLDRLWRDHVASAPDEVSPFATSNDPARSAVEILCAVLREGSGTPTELAWALPSPLPPVPAARLVRAVEELLTFARAADTASVTIESDDGAVLIRLATEPDLAMPEHLAAALAAAGLQVCVDAQVSVVTTHVPWPDETPAWTEA
jgi:hypothetical protein